MFQECEGIISIHVYPGEVEDVVGINSRSILLIQAAMCGVSRWTAIV